MIRSIANDLLVDVLLYLQTSYKQQMVNTITSEMNRLYKLFKERNPTFKGKVSIYAHSLGK
jgi:hypothetical protein